MILITWSSAGLDPQPKQQQYYTFFVVVEKVLSSSPAHVRYSDASTLTPMLPGFTQMLQLRISPECKRCQRQRRGGRCESAASLFRFLSSYCTHTHTPQDLLVNNISALLLNMSWKPTWVSSITHFLCCTLFLCNTAVCACVWHSGKKRKEIIH